MNCTYQNVGHSQSDRFLTREFLWSRGNNFARLRFCKLQLFPTNFLVFTFLLLVFVHFFGSCHLLLSPESHFESAPLTYFFFLRFRRVQKFVCKNGQRTFRSEKAKQVLDSSGEVALIQDAMSKRMKMSSKDRTFEEDDEMESPDADSMGEAMNNRDSENNSSTGDSFSGDSSSNSGKRHQTTAQNDQYGAGLAKDETRAIRRLKLGMVVFLLCVAGAIAGIVYAFTNNVQQSEFEAEFLEQGTKLVSGFSSDSFQKMQALDGLSRALNLHNESWPFVTIPNSHDFFQPFLSLANAASIKILPIVQARQRIEWVEHVDATKGWVEQDLKRIKEQQQGLSKDGGRNLQSIDDEEDDSTSSSNTYGSVDSERVSPFIKNYAGVDTSPELWLPWWQYAPVIEDRWFVNFNQLADSEFYSDFQIMSQTKNAIIAKTESYLPGLDFQSTRDFTFLQQLLAAGGYGQYEPGEPIGFIHYPVFRSVETNDEIVAVITATVYWKTYFQDILPDSAKGVICVVENDVQTFTYKIDGGQAIFLGMEDLHDPVYDDYEITADYKSFESEFAENGEGAETGTKISGGQRYTGVPVDDTKLAYRIRVYPSSEFEEPYDTNEPWLYAIAAGAIM